MKKTISILCILLLAFVTLIAGNYYLKIFTEEDAAVKKKSALIANEDYGFDNEYMEYYGIKAFSSNLPIIKIETGGAQIIKEEETWGRVGIIDSADGKNAIDGDLDASLYCTVKLRGASSYTVFDKLQYRITFYKKENGKKMNYALCGMTADSEWVLNGPYLDKTMNRNSLVYHMGQDLNLWSPDFRYAEVFVNGQYQGLYLVVQPVSETKGRLSLSKYGLIMGQTPYILKRDSVGTENNVLHTWGETMGYSLNELSISYPKSSKLTFRQTDWITRDISSFEKTLYSDYFADETIGYAKYIDIDSFVDYYILNEAVLNHDAGILSTYCYKELGGKLKMAIWDYNNAFDNYQWFIMETDRLFMNDNSTWFSRLVQDRAFVDKLCKRYRELRQNSLSTETMYKYIDETQTLIHDASVRNDKIWGYTYNMGLLTNVNDQERNPSSREEALSQLKKVISDRLVFLDSHIEDLYAGCIN